MQKNIALAALALLLSGIALADDQVVVSYPHFEQTEAIEANRLQVEPKLPIGGCQETRYYFDPNNPCNYWECTFVDGSIEDVYDSAGRYKYTLRTCNYSCTLQQFALAPGC